MPVNSWWPIELWEQGGAIVLFSWCFWIIASVVLHELAHGFTALRCGDTTPTDTGHITWNPVVHMGLSGLIMFALLGVTWGAMPVDPSRFRGRYDDARVSFAGPVTNAVLALACVVGASVLIVLAARGRIDYDSTAVANLSTFFRLGALLNLVLVMLNLLPLPPLDGSRILAAFSTTYRGLASTPQARQISLVALILIFVFGGNTVFGAATDVAITLIDRIVGVFM